MRDDDLQVHIEDSLRTGELEMKDGSLPQQTIVLKNGREVTRTIRDISGPAWGFQNGTCGYNAEWMQVYRDNETDPRWFEAGELPDIDEPDVSHRQDRNREIHATPVAQGRRFSFEPANSTEHDDRCSCPACSGLCQDDYEFYSGTGRYSSKNK